MVSLGRARRCRTLLAVGVAAIGCWSGRLAAQGSPDLPLDDVAYKYIDALISRGRLRELSILERPYSAEQVRHALRADSAATGAPADPRVPGAWMRALAGSVRKYERRPAATGLVAAVALDAFAGAQTSGRRDLLRPDDDNLVAPGGVIRYSLGAGPVVAVGRLQADARYKHDPEFFGQKDRAVTGRTEDAYVRARWRYGEVFFGREGRNWGPSFADGLQLGHSAYTYDHLLARLGAPALNATLIVAKLDDISLGPDTTAHRYLGAHRFAAVWRGFELAVSEAILYGGVDRNLETAFVNPLSLFNAAQYNEGESGNVSYSLELGWRSRERGVFAAQLLVDDVQVDRCSPNCLEPPSYGVTLSAEGLPLSGSQRWFASYTRISNLTYRTPTRWETYTSAAVGLGRAFSDYDEVRVGLDLAVLPSVPLRAYLAHRRQGAGDYRLAFPAPSAYAATPEFLQGPVTRTSRAALSGGGRLREWLELTGDVGLNRMSAPTESEKTSFEGRLTIAIAPFWRRDLTMAER